MNVIDRIKKNEGYRQWAYECPAGYLTIGYGTRITSPGPGVSEDIAHRLLIEEVSRIKRELDNYEPFWALNPVQQDALVEMAYQMGVKGLMSFKKMWRALDDGDWYEAQLEALDS